jgi:hypothetical protein
VDFGMIEAEKVCRRGEGDEAAGMEKGDARGELESFANFVRDENDGLVEAASEGAEFALKFSASDGIEGAERFVQEKDRRVGGKSASDTDALALATREFAGASRGKFGRFEAY